jgi:hypothetical protein
MVWFWIIIMRVEIRILYTIKYKISLTSRDIVIHTTDDNIRRKIRGIRPIKWWEYPVKIMILRYGKN